jgi:hypothetical protein
LFYRLDQSVEGGLPVLEGPTVYPTAAQQPDEKGVLVKLFSMILALSSSRERVVPKRGNG